VNDDDVIVTMVHLRAAKLCSRGGRRWCDRYGLDWQTFRQRGYPASVLLATGDEFAFKVVEVARGQQ
jgi:hypothetical protein